MNGVVKATLVLLVDRRCLFAYILFIMKRFSSNRITTKQLRSLIVRVAKDMGVNFVTFNDKGKSVLGTYEASKKSLYLNAKQTKRGLLQTFFHELGHHAAIKSKRWLDYHLGKKKLSAEKQFFIENKVDQIAKKLWLCHVDTKQWGMYKYTYLKSKKKYLMNWLYNHND